MTKRAAALAAYLIPVIACFAVFWPGLDCWFAQDDFAWLGLRYEIHDFAGLLKAMFEPKAQGSIRPWSERVFFLGFHELFGMDALPYRLCVFATQMLNLLLLGRLAFVLERRYVAALFAPLLWGVNVALGVPLSWTSSYNQILCAAFLLCALLLFIHYAQTGERKFYWAQFAIFVLGFGALEINVAYPAVAFAYAFCYAPKRCLSTIPMGAVSAAYIGVHNHYAPKLQSGPYALHFDSSILRTLLTYWSDALGGSGLKPLDLPPWFKNLGAAAPFAITF